MDIGALSSFDRSWKSKSTQKKKKPTRNGSNVVTNTTPGNFKTPHIEKENFSIHDTEAKTPYSPFFSGNNKKTKITIVPFEGDVGVNTPGIQSANPSEGILIFENQETGGKIFLGSKEVASNGYWLDESVRYVLNVTREVKNYFPEKFEYKQIKVSDCMDTQLIKFFGEATEYIHSAVQQGSSVLVHCSQGRSRSVTILIAYALRFLEMSLKEAYENLKSKTDRVNLNEGFKHQLMEYEKSLHGTNSLNFFDAKSRRLSSQKSPNYLAFFSTDENHKRNKPRTPRLQKTPYKTPSKLSIRMPIGAENQENEGQYSIHKHTNHLFPVTIEKKHNPPSARKKRKALEQLSNLNMNI